MVHLHCPATIRITRDYIWNRFTSICGELFIWKMMHKRLPTRDILQLRITNWRGYSFCVLHDDKVLETPSHVFSECRRYPSVSNVIEKSLGQLLPLRTIHWHQNGRPHWNPLSDLTMGCTMWHNSFTRNNIIFRNHSHTNNINITRISHPGTHGDYGTDTWSQQEGIWFVAIWSAYSISPILCFIFVNFCCCFYMFFSFFTFDAQLPFLLIHGQGCYLIPVNSSQVHFQGIKWWRFTLVKSLWTNNVCYPHSHIRVQSLASEAMLTILINHPRIFTWVQAINRIIPTPM